MSTDQWITIAVFVGFTFLFDAILLGIIVYTQRKVAQARDWPSTMGTVMASAIIWRRSSNKGSVAYPSVQYAYQVMGRPYQGTKIMPGPDAGGSGAHKIVERYPAGKQVQVYYDPNDPSTALLERDTPSFIKILWVVIIALDVFMCGIGAAILFFTT